VPIGQNGDTPPPHLPDDIEDISPSSTIADYFWYALLSSCFWTLAEVPVRFAKIIYLDDTSSKPVHVQWLEHGSQILMEELAHPQELFYNELCGSIPYKTVVGKVTVHDGPKAMVKVEDFFVK
jgi:DNA (cytosine-5)-methyltransferase 1